jgi:hypothetical protein
MHPLYITFQIPASGRLQPGEELFLAYYVGQHLQDAPDAIVKNIVMSLNHNHIGMMMFAISLLHCKNIAQIEKGGKRPEIKNRRHRNKGTVHYVLDVVPARNVRRTEYDQPAKGVPQRLHFRRGHFKEYTAERPLFGKYTGTFWWEAHVAGSAEIGEVKKDYRILPKQA